MMNMNKVEVGLAIAVVGIVLLVGGMIYYEQTGEVREWMDEHPNETLNFTGPDITNLGPMFVVVLVIAITLFIILKLSPKDDKK